MQLIHKIEIRYLRSLYFCQINNASDINIIFGRNDSGKSNVLRALHLFFTQDSTTPLSEMDFQLDFSDIRRKEAREAKGRQFISVRVDFNVPASFRNSLGTKVSVKRQWNIDGGMTETPPPKLTTGQKVQLTKFLNQISYNYVPAIKDTDVFQGLLERLFSALYRKPSVEDAFRSFAESLGQQTEEMSQELVKSLGADTRVAAPADLGDLFRALDFAHGDDRHSLLVQKGDGIRARHLPALLRYINDNEPSKFFIWGFEEPENSLDLASASAEAAAFAEYAARSDTQVFITSHSPIFFLYSEGDRSELKRLFISKQASQGGEISPTNAAQPITSVDHADSIMTEAGLLQLPFIIRQVDHMKAELDRRAKFQVDLEKQLRLITKPTLFVEGKWDTKMFQSSLARLGGRNVDVKEMGGAPSKPKELFSQLLKEGGLGGKVHVLFDNDRSGRAAYNSLFGCNPCDEPQEFSPTIHAWCLPPTPEFRSFVEAHDILLEHQIFEAEFLYDPQEAGAVLLGLLSEERRQCMQETIHNDYHKNLPQQTSQQLRKAVEGSPEWLYSRTVPDDLKRHYLDGVSALKTDTIDAVCNTVLARF